jgi:predicted permease
VIDGLRRSLARLAAFVHGRRLDRDLRDEMEAHLTLAEDDYVRAGRSREEARRLARLDFGGHDAAVEGHRDARAFPLLQDLRRDIAYALRTIRREPAFALVAIVVVALGIGANTAVFSVVNPLLLRPLPFHDADRLVWIAKASEDEGLSAQTYPVSSFEEFARRSSSLDGLTAYFAFFGFADTTLVGSPAEHVVNIPVGPRFFELLGVQPALGRLFTAQEERPNGPSVALISHALWQRRFNGDPDILARAVAIHDNGGTRSVTIVGVLPAGFDFGAVFSPGVRADLFTPAPLDQMRGWGNTMALVGRLKPGISVRQAGAELKTVGAEVARLRPELAGRLDTQVSALKDHVAGRVGPTLITLWCAVAFVWLIVCANLSNLLLARMAARMHEMSVRLALGAGRGRLVRQTMTESLVLTAAGTLAGIPLAYALTSWARSGAVTSIPLLSEIRLDGAALWFTVATALVTGLVIGAVPSLRLGASLADALRDRSRGSSDGPWQHRVRGALVVGEIALACVLLVGASLLLRSFMRLLDEDLGFAPRQAITIPVNVPDGVNGTARSAFGDEVRRQAASVPGVEAVGLTDALPLDRNRQWDLARPGDASGFRPGAFVYVVGPGYLEAMGVPIIKGRDFTTADRADSQPVIMLSETIARTLFPGQDPVGRDVENGVMRRIVAVVADVRQTALEEGATPQMYVPYTQAGAASWSLVVRSRRPADVVPRLRRALAPLDPTITTAAARPVEDLVDRAISPRRFLLSLVGGFSAAALLLACLGIYGVIAYNVARRTPEIGVRMALGATASDIGREVLVETLRLAGLGVVIGGAAAFGLARLLNTLLFATSPSDPLAFGGTALALVLVALAGGLLPALRASRVNPMTALRAD